jgi:Holliday junction resolvase
MGRSEREKGRRGELEVRDLFRAAGFDCDRVPNSGGLRIRGDLYGTVPFHVEVKRQERPAVLAALRQAAADADGLPYLVAFRQSRSPWYGAAPLSLLLDVLGGR